MENVPEADQIDTASQIADSTELKHNREVRIMIKKLSTVVIASLIFLAGCRAAQGISRDELLGVWVYDGAGYAIEFKEDGSYTIGAFDPPEFGDFIVEGTNLMLAPAEQARICPGLVGTYRIELEGSGKLHLTLITDECSIRAEAADDSLWSRPSD